MSTARPVDNAGDGSGLAGSCFTRGVVKCHERGSLIVSQRGSDTLWELLCLSCFHLGPLEVALFSKGTCHGEGVVMPWSRAGDGSI